MELALNKFTEGVNTDVAEDLLPNQFLSGGHNIKLTNHDNKQGIAQKQESYIKQLDGYGDNLKPLAAKVFKDIIYIVSYNTISDYVEFGTFPSADLTTRSLPDGTTCDKVYKYAPLPNFQEIESITANPSSFINVEASGAAPLVSTITTGTGANWTVVSTSDGITSALPASGTSGSNITITVADNTGPETSKSVTLEDINGETSTTISIIQNAASKWIVPSPDVFNDVPASSAPTMLVTVTTYGPDWIVTGASSNLTITGGTGPSGYYFLVDIDDNLGGPSTVGLTVETVEGTPVSDQVVFHQLGV